MSPLDRILRFLYGWYVPEPVRNSLRLSLALLVRDREPIRVAAPTRGRIVALAPHMDDEVFGCGGTLAHAAANGCDVTVVFITDGSKGYPRRTMEGREPAEVEAFERDLALTRKAEARRASALLGLRAPRFLDLPDATLAITPAAVQRLATTLAELRPDAVFLPFLTDIHHDHWLTNGLFIDAAAEARLAAATECWGYEVWLPLPANVVVDIGERIEAKRLAMEQFVSQRVEYDYSRAIGALNVYRSLFTDRGAGFGEAFYRSDLALYCALYRSIVVGHRRRPPASPPAAPALEEVFRE